MSCSPTGREVDVDMSSDDDFAAAKFAAAQAEYAQHLADKAAKKARRAQVQKQQRILVPDSPSPRKRRALENDRFHSELPALEPYDSTLAGPPIFDSQGVYRSAQVRRKQPEDDFLASKPIRESKFVANLAKVTIKAKTSEARKADQIQRSSAFDLADPTARAASAQPRRERIDDSMRQVKRIGATEKGGSSAARSASGSGQVKAQSDRHDKDRKIHAKVEKIPSDAIQTKRPAVSRSDSEAGGESDDSLDILDAPTKPPTRNRDGTVIEHIELGPIDHKPPRDDPTFEKTEPNSGIALKPGSRLITHEQVQLHLSDRYHLTPALVYSLARKQTGTDYVDIDVDADFVVIGVLAYKGPIRTTNPSNRETSKERKNVRFSLVDFSTTNAAASGTGTLSLILFEATSVDDEIERDGYKLPRYTGGSGGAYEKFWKESPGAVVAILNPRILRDRPHPGYPNTYTITPGSADSMMVIGRSADLGTCQALKRDGTTCKDWCDARQRNYCQFHVEAQIKRTKSQRLETANVSVSLGKSSTYNAKDFKKAMAKGGASSRSRTSDSGERKKSTTTYDPVTKTGLLPRDGVQVLGPEGTHTYAGRGGNGIGRRGGVEYITPAQLRAKALESGNGSGGYILGVRDGPEAELLKEERAKRKRDREKMERETRRLVEHDKGASLGGEYVQLAKKQLSAQGERSRRQRKVQQEEARKDKLRRQKADKALGLDALDEVEEDDLWGGQGREDDEGSTTAEEEGGSTTRRRGKQAGSSGDDDDDESTDSDSARHPKKRPFSVAAVRLIGFNPTNVKDREDDETKKVKLETISSLMGDRATSSLAPPPGPRVRSGVSAPADVTRSRARTTPGRDGTVREADVDEDEDDDDGDDDPSDLAKLDERLAARKLVTSTSRSSLAERVDDPSVDAISTSKIATRSTDRTDDDDDDDDDFVIEGGPIEGRIRLVRPPSRKSPAPRA